MPQYVVDKLNCAAQSSNSEGSCGSVRKEFSAKTKRAAWERANGQCELCKFPIDIGGFHYDHICPDWFSRDDELSNCQLLCVSCHKAKTTKDIKAIAKSKRIKDKRIKARKKGKFRGWRKFDGSVVYNRD